MRKRIAVALCGALAVFLCRAAAMEASIIPPIGLAPGSEYQLIFVTSGTTNAESSDIATYNSFVTAQAAPLIALIPSSTWTAVGSTPTVNADVNAPNPTLGDSYVPVYNTQGQLVTAAGLYSDIIPVHPIVYTQTGAATASAVWTGSSVFGTAAPADALGSSLVQVGISNDGGNPGWLSETAFAQTGAFPLYGLSSVLTVPSPEPSTHALAWSAFLLIGGIRFLRSRRAAAH